MPSARPCLCNAFRCSKMHPECAIQRILNLDHQPARRVRLRRTRPKPVNSIPAAMFFPPLTRGSSGITCSPNSERPGLPIPHAPPCTIRQWRIDRNRKSLAQMVECLPCVTSRSSERFRFRMVLRQLLGNGTDGGCRRSDPRVSARCRAGFADEQRGWLLRMPDQLVDVLLR